MSAAGKRRGVTRAFSDQRWATDCKIGSVPEPAGRLPAAEATTAEVRALRALERCCRRVHVCHWAAD